MDEWIRERSPRRDRNFNDITVHLPENVGSIPLFVSFIAIFSFLLCMFATH